MVTQSTTIPTVALQTTDTSSSRARSRSRLRSLNSLRNYTQSHIFQLSPSRSPASPVLSSGRGTPVPPLASAAESTALPGETSLQSTSGGSVGLDISSLGGELSSIVDMARSRSGTVPLSYRGLTPTYSTAAVEFARLDRTTESNPPLAVASSTMPAQRSASASQNAAISGQVQHGQKNSIRFCAHHDGRSQRPSLQFNAISRVMPSEAAVIKVGRYSEREEKNTGRDQNMGTTGPVGFKSKVVSRRHCEFWCQGGQWFIKDCASSSGTFLNHIRLSQPNVESRPFPVNDGDVIQLGIDFKGGEEAIFRCVKIRVETNRGWQNVLNNFNMTTHKQLRSITKGSQNLGVDTNGAKQSTECSICLNAIAPYQSLFYASCSHVWHFKCIRPILNGNMWPQFLCPNCRKVSDLEADVDEPVGVRNWEDDDDDEKEDDKAKTTEPEQANSNGSTAAVTGDQQNGNPTPASPFGDWIQADAHLTDEIQTRLHITGEANTDGNNLTEHTGNQDDPNNNELGPSGDAIEWTPERPGVPIVGADRQLDAGQNGQANDGPLTPRNTAGPFVFDGSAGGQADVPNSDILGP